MKWNANLVLALVFILSTFALFFLIVLLKLGGDTTLGVIIGHTAAWVEMVAFYYFRKKLKDGKKG